MATVLNLNSILSGMNFSELVIGPTNKKIMDDFMAKFLNKAFQMTANSMVVKLDKIDKILFIQIGSMNDKNSLILNLIDYKFDVTGKLVLIDGFFNSYELNSVNQSNIKDIISKHLYSYTFG